MHLDADCSHSSGRGGQSVQVEVGVEFAVEPCQDVLVERRGDPWASS